MRRRIIANLAIVVAVYAACARESRTSVEEVKTIVEREFPLGSAPQHSLRMLDSLGVEPSHYLADRTIGANFGTSSTKGWVTSEVFVRLYFDESDRLVRRVVEELHTGP